MWLPRGLCLIGWRDETFQTPSDVVFTRAFGIDPEGNIVGFYQTKDALGALHAHGFVATRSGDN